MALAAKRNQLTEAQDRLKTVGKEGYMRLAAEVETYKVRFGGFLIGFGLVWLGLCFRTLYMYTSVCGP